MKKLFAVLTVTFFVFKIHSGIFSNYQKKSPEENAQDLAIEQINNPTDPYINYNLGVALYQTRKYDAAKNNFERAITHTISKDLKERSYFNLGNSCYKNTFSMLPVNWEDENTKIEPEKLSPAIQEIKSAIKNYETLIELNKENVMAKTNLKKAKEILEKLNKKHQQQKQNKQDQNQDKQQDKQDEKQEQDNSSEDKSNQQPEQKPQQSEQQKDQNKSQESSDQREQGEKKQSQENQRQPDQKQDSQHNQHTSDNQEKQSEQRQEQNNASQQQNQEPAEQMQQIPATATQNENKKESGEQKAMRLMLENLQKDEEHLQKTIIHRQTKDQKPLESNQKPW